MRCKNMPLGSLLNSPSKITPLYALEGGLGSGGGGNNPAKTSESFSLLTVCKWAVCAIDETRSVCHTHD